MALMPEWTANPRCTNGTGSLQEERAQSRSHSWVPSWDVRGGGAVVAKRALADDEVADTDMRLQCPGTSDSNEDLGACVGQLLNTDFAVDGHPMPLEHPGTSRPL